MKEYKYILKNLDCANCARKIEERLSKENNYSEVIVNFSTLILKFKCNDDNPYSNIKKIINEVEPNVMVKEIDDNDDEVNIKYDMCRLVLSILLMILSFVIKMPYNIIFIVLAYIILLYRVVISAVKLLVRSLVVDEHLLISISCIGAFLIGERIEGLMVIFLYEVGELLEGIAVNHSRKSISNLMNIRPEYANLKDGSIVNPKDVRVNDVIVVKPGEKIPLDGIVIKGNTNLDMSSLTGESNLVSVNVDDKVLSGSINLDGLIEVRVVNDYNNSTVNKILDLVNSASDKKANTEKLVSKIAKVYTPIVILIAVFLMAFLIIFTDKSLISSVYSALVILVISCPCSIAISVPLSYFSGIGKASSIGVLVKGSNYLDYIGKVNEIIFDKTGTLTTGKFSVKDIIIVNNKYSEDDILKYAYLGEQFSNHPLAKTIIRYCKNKYSEDIVTDYKEVVGKGITYKYKNKLIKVGNRSLVNYKDDRENTSIYVSVDNKVIGYITFNDSLKNNVIDTINNLKKYNIRLDMFTGDTKESALNIGKKLKLDNIEYELLPQDKYKKIDTIISKAHGIVAFVGDGINDAPVLARADIGISMGGIGSEAAIEASDIVIMNDDISKIIDAINISKFTDKIIKENLIFAILVKIVILILSIMGYASMWQAIFADVGVTLITILNSLRILKSKY